jgi:LAO/AO transport system kinase
VAETQATEVLTRVPPARRPVDVDAYADGVLASNRTMVARAVTLVESSRADDREAAQRLLVRLLPHAGKARRVGITGVPGVGKSTFIDALGMMLVDQGHRVAVLAVDPSSTRTGGSILGDKTRMADLSAQENAFIRPSPTAGTLGGVAKATREAIVIMEAAGYDVVLVETVGVGQSETTVADMVDTFLFLTLARTGDQLQGIKKGVLELADVIAVNKADGPHLIDAQRAARELAGALRMLRAPDDGWRAPVLTCSAIEKSGLDEVWGQVVAHQDLLDRQGLLSARRRRQQVDWTWAMVHDRLLAGLHAHPAVRALAPELERRVREGTLTPSLAADALLAAYTEHPGANET